MSKSLEYIIRRAALAKYCQCNHGNDKETKVTNSAKKLEGVKKLSERQI